MIDLITAEKILVEKLKGREVPAEKASVRSSLNRMLASDVASLLDIPPFDRAAMDGFAVIADDVRQSYRVIETVRAGFNPVQPLTPGTCIKIMTGAPMPKNAGKVIPVENVKETAESIAVLQMPPVPHFSACGEDVRQGQKVATAGRVVDAVLQAFLISCGVDAIDVRRPVRVTVFSTGDELVDRMEDWQPGKIFDSNGPLLANLARASGCEVVRSVCLADDRDLTIRNMREALHDSDLVFLSGGVSAGEYDFIPAALTACGLEIHFSRVLIKPGKPMTFASGKPGVVLAFPGNPVTAYLMFHLFGFRAIRLLQGVDAQPSYYPVALAAEFKRRNADRLEFVPSRLDDRGKLVAVECHGSAHFGAMAGIHGFFVVQPGVSSVAKDTPVLFWSVRMNRFES